MDGQADYVENLPEVERHRYRDFPAGKRDILCGLLLGRDHGEAGQSDEPGQKQTESRLIFAGGKGPVTGSFAFSADFAIRIMERMLAQLGEHHPKKVEVIGSSPIPFLLTFVNF